MMEEIAAGSDVESLGATASSENAYLDGSENENIRLQLLEKEQERLNVSLMALTTHFGQVQFRLKQIVAAPPEDKERLLQELDEFAFRGCPNLEATARLVENPIASFHEHIIEEQRLKQKNLIEQLRNQLQDLETYAYQSGNTELPSNLVLEKQRIIIDELKEKIDFPLENFDKLSNDELKKVVDSALCQIVNPVKIKEQLVNQLQTQISDLERFIAFLQGEASSPGPYVKNSKCANCGKISPETSSRFPVFDQPTRDGSNQFQNQGPKSSSSLETDNPNSNQSTIDLLKKILSIMQLFALTQLGCGSRSFEKNTLKKSANHWGDLRANLEIAVTKVLRIHTNFVQSNRFGKLKLNSAATESDDEQMVPCPNELIRAIRKDLACSLRDLLQHGLIEVSHSSSMMVPFGCFVVRSKENQIQMHAWDLLFKYYESKHGKEFTQSATNKLSQSFSLNVVAGKVITIKQSLLNAIETIMKIHKNDMSNKDSCFKAFVCLSINEKKLVLYLKQILKSTVIIENYYQSWSYVKATGFDDALKSLDQLKILNSNLPVDKSTRRKSNNKDLF